jgi:hypothetical protein
MPTEPSQQIEGKNFSKNVSKNRVPVAMQVWICLASLRCSLGSISTGFEDNAPNLTQQTSGQPHYIL